MFVRILCLTLLLGSPGLAAAERPTADLNGDLVVNGHDFALFAEQWLTDARPPVKIRWFGHTSFKMWREDLIIYLDPSGLMERIPDASLILVSHTHSDHYSAVDITGLSNPDTLFIGATSAISQYGSGHAMLPGDVLETHGIRITAIPSYNISTSFHPRSNNWLGFILEIDDLRIYYAGDTDAIDEMKALTHIDVAIIPIGGTYTMNATQAAAVTHDFMPALTIPSHWGRNVGTQADADLFADQAYGLPYVMDVGETINLKNLSPVCPAWAHWPLDETTGTLAYDLDGAHTGTLNGDATWTVGQVQGAVMLDGDNDDINTGFVLNPALGPFTAAAWIKSDVPGRAILSQIGNTGQNWLTTNTDGRLRTDLGSGGRSGLPLIGDTIVTDGLWHHVALVFDGSLRHLYVDGALSGEDTGNSAMDSITTSMVIGSSPNRDADWQGYIDDVRIVGCALSTEELETLAATPQEMSP